MKLEERHVYLNTADKEELVGNYAEAERLAREVYNSTDPTLIEEVHDNTRALILLGTVALRLGDYTTALEHQNRAASIAELNDDKANLAKAFGSIGIVYWSMSDYPKALEYHTKALSLDQELGNSSGVGRHLGNIGVVYLNLSDYPKALEFFSSSLAVSEELGDTTGVARCLGNIGLVYVRLSDYPKAIENMTRTLQIYEESGNKAGVATYLGNIGVVYRSLAEYPKALEYTEQALHLAETLGNKALVAAHLGNIGIAYKELSDYSRSLEYYVKALRIDEELGNKEGAARHLGNIGVVYWNLSDYPKALEYYTKALRLNEELGNRAGAAHNLGNIGVVHMDLHDYIKALEYLTNALNMDDEQGNIAGVAKHLGNIGRVYQKLADYGKALEYSNRSLRMLEELGRKAEAAGQKAYIGSLYANTTWEGRDDAIAESYLLDSIAVSEDLDNKMYDSYRTLSELYKNQERWKESRHYLEKYLALRDEVMSADAKKTAMQLEQRRQIAEREKEIAIAKAAADGRLMATTTLLHKVLPETVATRMIDGEDEIADYFPHVSILFADIVGFTPISAVLPATIVVRLLNYIFAEFDRIIKKHGCEKIKTIGDGYMAVCGAPVECDDHAERLAAAALEMQNTLSLPASITEFLPSGVELGIRIGLHTGSVVAGVIGEERFVYDIYSDAVNTAARMESHGEANRIHCSNEFYRHLLNRFEMTNTADQGFVFEKRGEMEIKGKGMMQTYFLMHA